MICPTCHGTGTVRDPDQPVDPKEPFKIVPGPTATTEENGPTA